MEQQTKVKLMRTGALILLAVGLIMIYSVSSTIGIGTLGICGAFLIHRVIETNYKGV